MLQMTGVSKLYRTSEVETGALRDVTLSVGAGEFVAVMGPSGCGKWTLLNILGLLDSPSSGSYKLFGEEVAGLPENRLTQLRRQSIGFVFQSFNLIDDLSVADNVEVALIYRGVAASERKKRVKEALEQVGMGHRARHRPGQLSGGQQQRVAIARALVAQPKLILADEPTGNLDSGNGAAAMAMLLDAVGRGTAVVMVTHAEAHAALAARVVRMLDGRLIGETRVAA